MSAGTPRTITRCDLLSCWSFSPGSTYLTPSRTAFSQSMCRSHRIGQSKTVHVYRLVSTGTMERMIYEQQMKKVDLSTAVVDNARKEDSSPFSTATSTNPADTAPLSGFLQAPTPPDSTKLLSLEESDVDGDQVLVSCVQKLGHWLVRVWVLVVHSAVLWIADRTAVVVLRVRHRSTSALFTSHWTRASRRASEAAPSCPLQSVWSVSTCHDSRATI